MTDEANPNVTVNGIKMTLDAYLDDVLARHPEFVEQLEAIVAKRVFEQAQSPEAPKQQSSEACEQAEEAAYYDELNRGYAKDRI